METHEKHNNTGKLLEQVVSGASSKEQKLNLSICGGYGIQAVPFALPVSIWWVSYGRCILRGDLRAMLDKAHEADIFVINLPI